MLIIVLFYSRVGGYGVGAGNGMNGGVGAEGQQYGHHQQGNALSTAAMVAAATATATATASVVALQENQQFAGQMNTAGQYPNSGNGYGVRGKII